MDAQVERHPPLKECLGVELESLWSVAAEIVRRSKTPLVETQLHGLLFFATGEALALTGAPLFAQGFVAGENGPCVEDVHRHLTLVQHEPRKTLSRGAFPPAAECGMRACLIVDLTLRMYASQISTWETRALTQSPGTPWSRVYVPSPGPAAAIDTSLIHDYYSRVEELIKTLDPLLRLGVSDELFVSQVMNIFKEKK